MLWQHSRCWHRTYKTATLTDSVVNLSETSPVHHSRALQELRGKVSASIQDLEGYAAGNDVVHLQQVLVHVVESGVPQSGTAQSLDSPDMDWNDTYCTKHQFDILPQTFYRYQYQHPHQNPMHFFRYHGLSIPKIDGAAYRHFTLRITRLQFISLTMWNDLTSKLVVVMLVEYSSRLALRCDFLSFFIYSRCLWQPYRRGAIQINVYWLIH